MSDTLLKRAQAAALLGISEATLDRLADKGVLTRVRMTGLERYVRFKQEELESRLTTNSK